MCLTARQLYEFNNTNGNIFNVTDLLYNSTYNCWGFVWKRFKPEEPLKWLEQETMEEFLQQKTIPSIIPENNDILVYRDSAGQLTHTALVFSVQKNLAIHKPGSRDLTIDKIDSIPRKHRAYGELTGMRKAKEFYHA